MVGQALAVAVAEGREIAIRGGSIAVAVAAVGSIVK
jgi:hypothetical protein